MVVPVYVWPSSREALGSVGDHLWALRKARRNSHYLFSITQSSFVQSEFYRPKPAVVSGTLFRRPFRQPPIHSQKPAKPTLCCIFPCPLSEPSSFFVQRSAERRGNWWKPVDKSVESWFPRLSLPTGTGGDNYWTCVPLVLVTARGCPVRGNCDKGRMEVSWSPCHLCSCNLA